MTSRRPIRGPLAGDRAARSDPDDLGLPGNGERALTQSERKWLLEQMAAQRQRPARPARSQTGEARHPPGTGSRSDAPAVPAPGEAPHEPRGEEIPEPSATRPGTDSFWSFG